MESLVQIQYGKGSVADVETDVSHLIKQTINQGINEAGGVLSFRLPADPSRFTDLNTILLRLEVNIKKIDGTAVPDAAEVCLEPGGMHSLFSACDVRFNDEVVSTMTAYPFTAVLSRYLGSSMAVRDGVLDTFDGTYNADSLSSTVDDTSKATYKTYKSRISNAVLLGRIYSDVLTSSRQYLPPGVTLGIDLRRAPDAFSLVGFAGDTVRVIISTASVYVRRLKLRPSLIPRVMESIKSGAFITFNRLDTKMMSMSKGSQVFRWLDFLNGAPLPNRLYIGFIAQQSLYGNVGQLSTFFETLNLASLNMKLNGRDLLVEPIRTQYTYAADGKVSRSRSDAKAGFLTITEVLNLLTDQTQTLRLNYNTYLQGLTIYAIELGKCGEKGGSSGCLDLELLFGTGGTPFDACVLIFSEKTEQAPIPARNSI